MWLLEKLFRRKSPDELCDRVFRLFADNLTAGQIVNRLTTEGFSEPDAARAVTFLPSAFARVHYAGSGIRFPEHYFPGSVAHARKHALKYAAEPIFLAAMKLAERLTADQQVQIRHIVEISAEHRGIEHARQQGLSPSAVSELIHEF